MSKIEKWKVTRAELQELVQALGERLGGIEAVVLADIESGEYEIALETMATQLHETQKTISSLEHEKITNLLHDFDPEFDTAFLDELVKP